MSEYKTKKPLYVTIRRPIGFNPVQCTCGNKTFRVTGWTEEKHPKVSMVCACGNGITMFAVQDTREIIRVPAPEFGSS